MSVRAMQAVWEHSQAKGGERLVLLAVADHAKHDGTGAWPSLATICTMTRFTERNVRYLLRRLEQMGELAIEVGTGPRGTNMYHLTLPGWNPETEDAEGAKIAPAKPAPPRQKRAAGGAKISQGGAKSRTEGGQPVAPDPSLDPSGDPSMDLSGRGRATPRPTLETFQPDGTLLAGLASERPDLDLAVVVNLWRDYHRERGTDIKDFNASLRRWVRTEKPPPRASPNGQHPSNERTKFSRSVAALQGVGGHREPADIPDQHGETGRRLLRRDHAREG